MTTVQIVTYDGVSIFRIPLLSRPQENSVARSASLATLRSEVRRSARRRKVRRVKDRHDLRGNHRARRRYACIWRAFCASRLHGKYIYVYLHSRRVSDNCMQNGFRLNKKI